MLKTRITKSGPFFKSDPSKTFLKNARAMMEALAEEGQRDVQDQMRAGEGGRRLISHGVTPGRVSAHVVGRVKPLSGRPWAHSAVVSVNNTGFSAKQGVALMAAYAQVERQTHAFRKTRGRISRARGVNLHELLDGLT